MCRNRVVRKTNRNVMGNHRNIHQITFYRQCYEHFETIEIFIHFRKVINKIWPACHLIDVNSSSEASTFLFSPSQFFLISSPPESLSHRETDLSVSPLQISNEKTFAHNKRQVLSARELYHIKLMSTKCTLLRFSAVKGENF